MKLSTKGRYAVMAMVDLATRSGGKPLALSDVAGGGYLLARNASETRISDIILAVDEPIHATRCTPGSPQGCRSNKSRCLTHDLWEELGNQIYLCLSSISVADVVNKRVLGISGQVYSQVFSDDPAVAVK